MEEEIKKEDQQNEVTSDQVKPKRVLTEAQRLAFMKGREKRLANLERKRQEKLEAEGLTEEPKPEPKEEQDPPPPMPVLHRQTNHIDDGMAHKIAELVYGKLIEDVPEPPKRKYTRKEKPVQVPRDPSPIHRVETVQQPIPQKTFNWM